MSHLPSPSVRSRNDCMRCLCFGVPLMTSWHGNSFHVTHPLWKDSTSCNERYHSTLWHRVNSRDHLTDPDREQFLSIAMPEWSLSDRSIVAFNIPREKQMDD